MGCYSRRHPHLARLEALSCQPERRGHQLERPRHQPDLPRHQLERTCQPQLQTFGHLLRLSVSRERGPPGNPARGGPAPRRAGGSQVHSRRKGTRSPTGKGITLKKDLTRGRRALRPSPGKGCFARKEGELGRADKAKVAVSSEQALSPPAAARRVTRQHTRSTPFRRSRRHEGQRGKMVPRRRPAAAT